MKTMLIKKTIKSIVAVSIIATSATAMSASYHYKNIRTQIGADNNSVENTFLQPEDPALSGGGRDQTMQFGDVIFGTYHDDLLVGGLGTDVIAGGAGNDVILGGVEHFNPSNRDRAFGGSGHDIFIWKPGDGSDTWNGGRGHDVVILGLVGEVVDGHNVFAVNKDKKTAELALDPYTKLPLVDVTNSPGFCDVVDPSSSYDAKEQLKDLGLNRLVRFSIRGVADAFDRGDQLEDNGLRVTLHLKGVETLICTSRAGGEIEVIDLKSVPARVIAHGVSMQELRSQIKSYRLRKRLEGIVF